MSFQEQLSVLKAMQAHYEAEEVDQLVDVFYHDDIVAVGYTPEPLVGKDAMRRYYRSILKTFPSPRLIVHDAFSSGNKMALRFTTESTLQRSLFGIEASGQVVRIDAMDILEFADGLCCRSWTTADALSLVAQLGGTVVPAGSDA